MQAFQVPEQFCVFHHQCMKIQLLLGSSNIWHCRVFKFYCYPSIGCVATAIVVLTCISLITNNAEHHFYALLG